MKKIPLKNYIILSIILGVSVLIVIYITNWFLATQKQNEENNNVNFIKEVKVSEINNYITENPNFIIYLKSSTSNNVKFEKKLKKFLIDNDIQKDFVYINLNDLNVEEYVNFINTYKLKNELLIKYNEALIIIDNQKITNILYKETDFDIKEVKKFLKDNGVY